MKKRGFKLAVLLLAAFTTNCEKDDICAETIATTPKVVIDFLDASKPLETKKVTQLKVNTTGLNAPIIYNDVSKIKLPLDGTKTQQVWQLIQNGADANAANDNTDQIDFSYLTQLVYRSRACGYINQYQLTQALLQTDATNWIQQIKVLTTNINSENETHIQIYF